jgi:hypothetical protein
MSFDVDEKKIVAGLKLKLEQVLSWDSMIVASVVIADIVFLVSAWCSSCVHNVTPMLII